jgi:hypothetical protein
MYGGVRVAPPFLISTLDGGEWSASRPGRFIHWDRASITYPFDRSWVEPRVSLDRMAKSLLSLPGIEPGRPVHSPSLYRLRSPGLCLSKRCSDQNSASICCLHDHPISEVRVFTALTLPGDTYKSRSAALSSVPSSRLQVPCVCVQIMSVNTGLCCKLKHCSSERNLFSSEAMFRFQHISKHMIWYQWCNTFSPAIVFVEIISLKVRRCIFIAWHGTKYFLRIGSLNIATVWIIWIASDLSAVISTGAPVSNAYSDKRPNPRWSEQVLLFRRLRNPAKRVLNSFRPPIRGRGSVVGWWTLPQAGRSRVRVPMRLIFFSLPNPPSRTMALGSTQPLTERSEKYFVQKL